VGVPLPRVLSFLSAPTLTAVRELKLNACDLTAAAFAAILGAIGPACTDLDVACNSLVLGPPETARLLVRPALAGWGDGSRVRLKRLRLAKCGISDVELEAVGHGLWAASESLELEGNDIAELFEGFDSGTERGSMIMHRLDVSGNCLTTTGADRLAQVAGGVTSLTVGGRVGTSYMPDAVLCRLMGIGSTPLKSLSVRSAVVELTAATAIAGRLAPGAALTLFECALSAHGMLEIAPIIQAKRLSKLQLATTGPAGATTTLARAAEAGGALAKLDVRRRCVAWDEMARPDETSVMTSLGLSRSDPLSADDLASLFHRVQAAPHLRVLRLRDCGIGAAASLRPLLDAMDARFAQTVLDLDLGGNEIGSAGSKLLACWLRSSTAARRLRRLVLGACGLDDGDCAEVVRSLLADSGPDGAAYALRDLDVGGGNECGPQTVESLALLIAEAPLRQAALAMNSVRMSPRAPAGQLAERANQALLGAVRSTSSLQRLAGAPIGVRPHVAEALARSASLARTAHRFVLWALASKAR